MENQAFRTGKKNSCFGVQAGLWKKEPKGDMPDPGELLQEFFPFIPTEEQKNSLYNWQTS